MGIEIVLIITITSGVMSLISGGVSIGSFFHFKQKFSSVTHDTTTVDIENEMVDEDVEWGHKTTKKQKIHIEDIDFETVNKEMGFTRTGLPNATAERLAGGASDALKLIAAPTSLGTKNSISNTHDEDISIDEEKQATRIHHKHEKTKKAMQQKELLSDSSEEELQISKPTKKSSVKIEVMEDAPVVQGIELASITASASGELIDEVVMSNPVIDMLEDTTAHDLLLITASGELMGASASSTDDSE